MKEENGNKIAIHCTPLKYSVTTRSYEWKSPAIPEILWKMRCKLRFQLIMLNQVVAIKDKTTSPTAEFTVETNRDTAAGRCTPGRGKCNHITLKCDCRATCGALNVRYEGDQCNRKPWCRMKCSTDCCRDRKLRLSDYSRCHSLLSTHVVQKAQRTWIHRSANYRVTMRLCCNPILSC